MLYYDRATGQYLQAPGNYAGDSSSSSDVAVAVGAGVTATLADSFNPFVRNNASYLFMQFLGAWLNDFKAQWNAVNPGNPISVKDFVLTDFPR